MTNLCVLPFNSVSIDAMGNLRACCSSGSNSYGVVAQSCTVEELFNNKPAIDLRKEMIAGGKPKNCERCWQMEAIGNSSFRHIANDNHFFGLKNNTVVEFTENISFENIQYLDITLGNKCNLACRMCNPYSSSLVAKHVNIIDNSKFTELVEFSRETKDKILELITKSVNLNSIYMLGGEPLVNDFHNEIINLLINTGRAKDIVLHYSTNLQIDVEKYLEVWSNFHIIELSVSIDGCGDSYEYIRWPGNWDKLSRNLKRVVDFRKEQTRDLLFPGIATTVQNLNAHNLPALIKAVHEIDPGLLFYFIPITGGYYLEMTPKWVLEKALAELEEITYQTDRISELKNMYRDALNKCDNLDPRQVAEFFKRQKEFDTLRNQNLFITHPHFLELATTYNIKTW